MKIKDTLDGFPIFGGRFEMVGDMNPFDDQDTAVFFDFAASSRG